METPSSREKDNLPIDIRYNYNRCIDQYQAIKNYELGVIKEGEFIEVSRSINIKYNKASLSNLKKYSPTTDFDTATMEEDSEGFYISIEDIKELTIKNK